MANPMRRRNGTTLTPTAKGAMGGLSQWATTGVGLPPDRPKTPDDDG